MPYANMLRIGSVLYHKSICLLPQCTPTLRQLRYYNKRYEVPKRLTGLSRADRYQLTEAAEEAEDLFNNEQDMPKRIKDEEHLKKRIKYKIIERKHFKPPQESNLLTYDAKEQMRYLHQEFPDEWTVAKLAESFPTSVQGVIKLLKSPWRPRSLAELQRHDSAVRKQWLALSSSETDTLGSGGPLEDRYQKLLESGTLLNADGIPSLPAPEGLLLLPDHENIEDVVKSILPSPDPKRTKHQRKKFVDIFAIKFQQNSETESKEKTEGKQKLLDFKRENANALNEIIQRLPIPKDERTQSLTTLKSSENVHNKYRRSSGRIPREKDIDELQDDPAGGEHADSMFDVYAGGYMEQGQVNRHKWRMFSQKAQATLEGDSEVPHLVSEIGNTTDPDELVTFGRRRLRRNFESQNYLNSQIPSNESYEDSLSNLNKEFPDINQRNEVENTPKTSYEKLQMEGTGRLRTRSSSMEPEYHDNATRPSSMEPEYHDNAAEVAGDIPRTEDKFYLNPEEQTVLDRIQYDSPGDVNEGREETEAFIYHPTTGYQHPYGRMDQQLNINVPQDQRHNPNRRYRKGNAIYDENGDLLFRVPK